MLKWSNDQNLFDKVKKFLVYYHKILLKTYLEIQEKIPNKIFKHPKLHLLIKSDLSQLTVEELIDLPDHIELLRFLKEKIQTIKDLKGVTYKDEEILSMLLSLLEISKINLLHEELLKKINNLLIHMILEKPSETLDSFITRFFSFLKQKSSLYPLTIFECIKSIGSAILKKQSVYLAEVYITEIIKYGFTPPSISGISSQWKVLGNPYHIHNIKVWLEIFKLHPEWCSNLLAALIVYIKLYGINVRDTDLFHKEISSLLNANITPIYNLTKQFCKQLPVYYHEIGAEGKIRDFSTELDEMFNRTNTLFHFLRKFLHIESSNIAIDFIENIFKYWQSLNHTHLSKFLPDHILSRIIVEELDFHLNMQNLIIELLKFQSLSNVESLLKLDLGTILLIMKTISFDDIYKQTFLLLFKLYKLILQKYKTVLTDLDDLIKKYQKLGYKFVGELPIILANNDTFEKIKRILELLNYLKENYILSSSKFPIKENIIQKRHIAADIPSLFGSYSEPKFDALSLTYYLENILDSLFSELVSQFSFQVLTKSVLKRILEILSLFQSALYIDGINSQRFNQALKILENSLASYPLTFNQYLDIVKGLLDGVKHILKSYYINIYSNVFALIYESLNVNFLLDKYNKVIRNKSKEEAYYSLFELIIKDILAESFVLRHLDNFIKKVYNLLLLSKNFYTNDELNFLLTYDEQKSIVYLHSQGQSFSDYIYLGNKAYSLYLLSIDPNIIVKIPKGFILTTELFRIFKLFKKYKNFMQHYEQLILDAIHHLEQQTGKKFGSLNNPLLVSVRSGAIISMPGMMSSILNVGLNPEIVENLAKFYNNEWFAWDSYRRFLQNWAMANGIPRDFFNSLMREHKRKFSVKKKREFSGEQMRELALLYRQNIEKLGIPIIDDPWEQLFKSIEMTINSWYHQKATWYRQIMEIAEEWGTAILIQEMVYGNKSLESGTGVVFTTSPYGKFPRIALWGDYTSYNQGEDIVSGLVNAYPISIEQKKLEGRDGLVLEEAFPEIYQALVNFAYYLVYEKGWDHQEIEFTFESPRKEDLYILQVRDIYLREEKYLPTFKISSLKKLPLIGKGIGVSGTILSGRVVFSFEDIESFKETGDPLILLRYDTVPDNVRDIALVDGLLTARGGQTSHAAIVANRLGKVCVVGCEDLRIDEKKKKAKIKDFVFNLGDWLTLNGMTGDIYYGKIDSRLM